MPVCKNITSQNNLLLTFVALPQQRDSAKVILMLFLVNYEGSLCTHTYANKIWTQSIISSSNCNISPLIWLLYTLIHEEALYTANIHALHRHWEKLLLHTGSFQGLPCKLNLICSESYHRIISVVYTHLIAIALSNGCHASANIASACASKT